jgi:adenosylmethionine-8-amino-7-oxononanoate aminotransferase
VYDAFLGADLGPRTFYHGHSYGGNALAAAVARRHLEIIARGDVLANVCARSAQLRELLDERLGTHPAVRAVRICGLMAGIELAPHEPDLRWGRRVTAATVERGVLVRPIGDVITLVPPLTITAGEIVRIVDAVSAAIDEVTTP